MDRIEELKSDNSSPMHARKRLGTTLQQNTFGNGKSSNSEIAFQAFAQQSEPRKPEQSNCRERSFEQAPGVAHQEELGGPHLYHFPGS